MNTRFLTLLAGAPAVALLLSSCGGLQPPAPPPGARSLDQPPGGNRYLQGMENMPQPPEERGGDRRGGQGQNRPGPMPVDPNQPYSPPLPPDADPAAVQPPNNNPPPPAPPNTTVNPPVEAPPPTVTQPTPAPTPPPTTHAPAGDQMPFGIKVPGKPGFVLSPYDKSAGIVDVQGIASGKKVKCPYTGKVFLVP